MMCTLRPARLPGSNWDPGDTCWAVVRHTHTRTHTHMHTHTRTHTHAHMHMHTHTHTHDALLLRSSLLSLSFSPIPLSHHSSLPPPPLPPSPTAPTCGANSNYSACMSPCPASCADMAAPSECEVTSCVEGCQCAPGFIMSEDSCVPFPGCGCNYLNRYHPVRPPDPDP